MTETVLVRGIFVSMEKVTVPELFEMNCCSEAIRALPDSAPWMKTTMRPSGTVRVYSASIKNRTLVPGTRATEIGGLMRVIHTDDSEGCNGDFGACANTRVELAHMVSSMNIGVSLPVRMGKWPNEPVNRRATVGRSPALARPS